MNLEVNSNRIDEIVFPHDSTMIMQKINAQIAEFNTQGTLVAIGCKYAQIIIMDFMTKEIVRCFSLYDDYDLATNSDVDQFSHFRRLNYAYLEDDFVLMQKPQDERETDSLIKREFKKIINFEPKDKSKCKAQIASIDWSFDSRFIAVSFKIENQIGVWDITTCQKIVQVSAASLGLQQIYSTKFSLISPMYLLVSGDKALVYKITQDGSNEFQILADNQEPHQNDSKLETSPNQQPVKRKSPKFSYYIVQQLIQNQKIYYLLINNTQKVMMILEANYNHSEEAKINDFFQIQNLKKKHNDKEDVEMKDEEKKGQSKESSEFYNLDEDELDILHSEETDQIRDSIQWINQKKFKIVSIVRFQSQNSSVQQISMNHTFTKVIMTCSDRVLRLYEIKYENIGQKKKIIFLRNEFQDVINRRKWMNASFLRLNSNTKISEQQSASQFLNELQQQWTNQVKQQESKDTSQNHNQQEIFVSSIGESGSNELKFYNATDFQNIQRLELTQEGCSYLTSHSKSHFSIMMVTTNGSLFLWSVRPAKIIQPLAPYFTEIEENQDYVEREDEFEKEISDEEDKDLEEDQKKKKKLAKINIDIETTDQFHLCNYAQIAAMKNNGDVTQIEQLFDSKEGNSEHYNFEQIISYVQVQISSQDSYGLLAKHNIDTFRDKFNKLCNMS